LPSGRKFVRLNMLRAETQEEQPDS